MSSSIASYLSLYTDSHLVTAKMNQGISSIGLLKVPTRHSAPVSLYFVGSRCVVLTRSILRVYWAIFS